ncbi:glycoside hydrolase family 113 [Hymenobacter sediminicola]|uniref:GTA TIM-barrel-like domain-containing protein n=1 Tax=Hymenobacter sediminicola TaxID=2761579 RepID=A0A7G7W452_9BACT|nr:hypothetical protein [Hymenobacter sediminicola]QNH61145.1 hypothetical protein H4317_13320 [Hymenobacter sediminicola]
MMATPFPVAHRVAWLLAGVLVLAMVAVAALQQHTAPRVSVPADAGETSAATRRVAGRLLGVNWVAADSASSQDMEPLVRAHVTWIAQTPFGWQPDAAQPQVRLHTGAGSRNYWGESDRGLIRTALLARQRGIRTMLKPHLWLRSGGTWPGDVSMRSEADWQQWFAAYTTFIVHYAALAETNGMEALCIGTELEKTVSHEAEWRALIERVRQVYHGPLTYAANWSGEFEQVKFWDALDYIGVQAYFPLSTTERPTKAALLKAWRTPLARMAAVQKRYGKPVLFTEAGYKTTPDAAIQPWVWPDRNALPTTPDETTQRVCYEAMFETFWPQPWFQGIFIWKWYPGLQPSGSARRHLDFTPQHKPAEQVMAQWYGK